VAHTQPTCSLTLLAEFTDAYELPPCRYKDSAAALAYTRDVEVCPPCFPSTNYSPIECEISAGSCPWVPTVTVTLMADLEYLDTRCPLDDHLERSVNYIHALYFNNLNSPISPSTAARFDNLRCIVSFQFPSSPPHRLTPGVFNFQNQHCKRAFLTERAIPRKQRPSTDSGTQSARCKLSAITGASAKLSLTFFVERLPPYGEHFRPTAIKVAKPAESSWWDVKKLGHPMVGMNVAT